MINLKEVKMNEKGHIQECFGTDNPRIKSVTFTYRGQEEELDNCLKSIIFDYAKKEKLIA